MIDILQSALIIFVLRVVDVSLYTLRIKMVISGRKAPAWVFAFFQSLVYVTAITVVLKGLDNWLNIIAYAAGFATGNVVGMWIENLLAIGYTQLQIISPGRGAEIVEKLRAQGYAVTEVAGRGKDGTVSLLNCGVKRRDTHTVSQLVVAIDPSAFITAENLRPVQRGFWRK